MLQTPRVTTEYRDTGAEKAAPVVKNLVGLGKSAIAVLSI